MDQYTVHWAAKNRDFSLLHNGNIFSPVITDWAPPEPRLTNSLRLRRLYGCERSCSTADTDRTELTVKLRELLFLQNLLVLAADTHTDLYNEQQREKRRRHSSSSGSSSVDAATRPCGHFHSRGKLTNLVSDREFFYCLQSAPHPTVLFFPSHEKLWPKWRRTVTSRLTVEELELLPLLPLQRQEAGVFT